MPPLSLSALLEERCATLRDIESEARRAIQHDNDPDHYRELMRHKAEILAALENDVTPYFPALPADLAARAQKRIGRFSASAANALALNSTFYMSALLYPEGHQEGQPNDLEEFVVELAAWK